MKKLKFSFLVLLCMLFSLQASGQTLVDGIYYTFSGMEATVVAKTTGTATPEYTGSIEIPAIVNYNGTIYNVTAIGDHAFYNCRTLTSISIPDGVAYIGDWAFYDCRALTSISIPDGVTDIGESAFSNCRELISITIPEGVTVIENCLFEYCQKLLSVTLPSTIDSISFAAFYYCKALSSVIIPEGVRFIEENTFSYCSSLTSIIIPERIRAIKSEAFSYCSNLTDVFLPVSLEFEYIDETAFENSNRVIFHSYGEHVDEDGIYYNEDRTILLRASMGLTSCTIPNTVTTIAANAFANCRALASIT